MLNNPDWSSIFAPNGRFLKEGETISRANLSRTLTIIAEEGADGFYKVTQAASSYVRHVHICVISQGPVADSIVRRVRETGGILSHDDLANYSVIVQRALEGTFRDKKIYTTHAPTSGPGALSSRLLLDKT
jgi:gamma-glutamyltranspeptidase/glutathione hydrolase/leukotriene-C4 hydrolase